MQNRKYWMWSKLSPSKWEDVWEERLAMLPPGSWMIVWIPGSQSIRLQAYGTKTRMAQLKKQFGGSIRVKAQSVGGKGLEKLTKPLRIRNKLIVTQGEKETRRLQQEWPARKVVTIPAGLAFGTGMHQTTAGCLRLLVDQAESLSGKSWSMADLGTGSGILAIAGQAVGADKVYAYDYDPIAVKAAQSNCRLNNVELSELRELDVLKWKPRRKFDVITANLFSEILQAGVSQFANALSEHGVFIFSGILRHQWAECRRAFESAGLEVTFFNPRGKWVYGKASVEGLIERGT